MPNKRYKAEQIVTLLRQIEVGIANGKPTPQACKEAEITVQTYYRWRKEYGGLKLDQAKRLKELERENAKLKRVVAELSLEKQVLKDIAEGNLEALSGFAVRWNMRVRSMDCLSGMLARAGESRLEL
jgi:putative transposase